MFSLLQTALTNVRFWGQSGTANGERVMPLNEIPKYFNPETRHLVDAALEDA